MSYNIQANIALPKIRSANRKQALEILATEISAKIQCSEELLLNRLIEKETKSSSGTGDGVAIPHLKLSGLTKCFIALATLNTPVDFKAIDNKPVDIICILLSPEQDGPIHLRTLSRVSRLLKNKDLCQRLRETNDQTIIKSLFDDPDVWSLAA